MPVIALLLASALWGLSFPLLKALQLEQVSRLPGGSSEFFSAWILTVRFALSAALLLPWVVKMRPTRNEIRQGLAIALWGGIGMGLEVDGLAHTNVSTSAFLTSGYCIFLPIWSALRERKFPGARMVVAVLLVMAGSAFLAGVRAGNLHLGRGEWETLLAAFFLSLQIDTLERPKFARNRGLPVTMVMCVGIAVFFLPLAVLTAPEWPALFSAGASWQSFVLIFAVALLCTVLGFLLMNTWQKRLPAAEAGLIYNTEPLFASFYALFLPGAIAAGMGIGFANEKISWGLVAGGGFVLAANLLMQGRKSPHRPAIAPGP